MSFPLNRRALERAKACVTAGDYSREAWSFSADESNAMLGDNNFTEFELWHLGKDSTADQQSKDAYAYPWGKAGKCSIAALEDAVNVGTKAGDLDVVRAAQECIATADKQDSDQAKASACDVELRLTASGTLNLIATETSADGKPKLRKFAVNAYNGGAMILPIEGKPTRVVIDLSGMEGCDKSRPFLHDHDMSARLGHTTKVINDGKTLNAVGVMSGASAIKNQVCEESENGFPWQASVGARMIAKEVIGPGETVTVNDQEFTGPGLVARRSMLGEISAVPLGADDSTSTRIAAHAAQQGVSDMDPKFKEWLTASGFDPEAIKGKQLAKLQGTYDAEVKAAALEVDLKAKAAPTVSNTLDITAKMRAEAAAESTRISSVRTLCAGFGDIEAKAIADGWDVSKTELAVLRAARNKPEPAGAGKPFMINTGAGYEQSAAILTAAACLNVGVREANALKGMDETTKAMVADKRTREAAQGFSTLCRAIYGQAWNFQAMSNDAIRAAFKLDIQATDSGTMSLSGITENILNKAMLEAYGAIASTVPDVAYETDTNDFKTFKRYRMTAMGDYGIVGAGGELEDLSLRDESYANQVITRGAIINVTREMLINDDMGAMTQMPTIMGRKAALARERAVYLALLSATGVAATGVSVKADGTAGTALGFNFFSAGALNYQSGSSSALSIAALTTAVQQFITMKDANGDYLLLQPDRLVVGPALKTVAEQLFSGANLTVTALTTPAVTSGPIQAASTATQTPNLNAHKGMYRPIVTPFLSTTFTGSLNGTSYTGTNTEWMLMTNPSGGFAPVQVGYLRGQRVPVIERGEADFDTLGIRLRSWYDFGVALHDWRTAQWSAGT